MISDVHLRRREHGGAYQIVHRVIRSIRGLTALEDRSEIDLHLQCSVKTQPVPLLDQWVESKPGEMNAAHYADPFKGNRPINQLGITNSFDGIATDDISSGIKPDSSRLLAKLESCTDVEVLLIGGYDAQLVLRIRRECHKEG